MASNISPHGRTFSSPSGNGVAVPAHGARRGRRGRHGANLGVAGEGRYGEPHDLRSVHAAGLEDGVGRHRRRRRRSGTRRSRSPPLAEQLGYDSIWVYDHFHNVPRAGARGDVRVLDDDGGDQPAHVDDPPRPDGRLHAYRNPGLLAKITSNIDVISRRPPRLGHRRRLVRARVPRLRLRVPDSRRTASRMLRETVEIVKLDVDRSRRPRYDGPYYQLVRRPVRPEAAAAAAPADLDRRRRRAADACASSPGTPTTPTSAASPTSGRTSARCCKGHCDAVGRDYDEIRKTWSPRGVHPRDRGRDRRGRHAQPLGRAVRLVARRQPRRHARAGVREAPGLRRPRLRRRSSRGAPTTPTPRR